MIKTVDVSVSGQGLYDISASIAGAVDIEEGLCTLFIRHTSASLLIQENYDPSAKLDLERWLNRLVPENDLDYTHLIEGPDDMPAHIKASTLGSSVSIPISNGRLALGTWQGVYLGEHRDHGGARRIIATLQGQCE